MKKFFAALTILTVFGVLQAADSKFHGTFLDAINETDSRIRVIKLIDAIEISTASAPADPNAVRMLKMEMDDNNPAVAENLSRLTALLNKKPEDFNLAAFCFNAATKYNKLTPELFAIFEKSISLTDISKLSAENLTLVINIARTYANSLISDNESARAIVLLDAMLAKKSDSIDLIRLETELITRICFMTHNTAPGLNGYDDLAADDPLKARLQNIGRKLPELKISHAAQAESLLNIAASLRLAQTPELLRQYTSRFPACDWAAASAFAAATFRDPELLVTGPNTFMNFISALHAKNFNKATAIIAGMPENYRQNCAVILSSVRGEHAQVTGNIASGKTDIKNVPLFTLYFIANSAFIQKDTALIKNILELVWQGKESGRIDDPEICNGIGYIASEFNIELEKAESLIRFAVKSSPQKCSFIDSLAWVLFRQGKVEEAENMITLALKYREASAAMCVLYLHAAEIKAAGQKFDEAKIMLNKAKQLYDPDDESCFDYNLQTEKRLERLLK